jgi:hypothetical protein
MFNITFLTADEGKNPIHSFRDKLENGHDKPNSCLAWLPTSYLGMLD